jgi:hypothetical protein
MLRENIFARLAFQILTNEKKPFSVFMADKFVHVFPVLP